MAAIVKGKVRSKEPRSRGASPEETNRCLPLPLLTISRHPATANPSANERVGRRLSTGTSEYAYAHPADLRHLPAVHELLLLSPRTLDPMTSFTLDDH